jgi:hypothetical protein
MTTPSGLQVWTNAQGWHWAEDAEGQFALGWTAIPYASVLGHMAVCAEKAELAEGAVNNADRSNQVLHVVAPRSSDWSYTA